MVSRHLERFTIIVERRKASKSNLSDVRIGLEYLREREAREHQRRDGGRGGGKLPAANARPAAPARGELPRQRVRARTRDPSHSVDASQGAVGTLRGLAGTVHGGIRGGMWESSRPS